MKTLACQVELLAADRSPSAFWGSSLDTSSAVRRRDYKESVSDREAEERRSLPPGMAPGGRRADARSMSAAVLTKVAPAASQRILADMSAFAERTTVPKEPALDRLEAALGRDFADRLVAALSEESGDRRR